MNKPIRHHVINGDSSERPPAESAPPQQSTDTAGEKTASSAAPASPAAVAQAKHQTKHQPAFNEPHRHPATPRDEHHGKGGMYAMVGGKRVPADDDGNPLPEAPASK
jgi:hypothetical protein